MNPEYYPDLKKLVSYPEWATYEKLLEDERQRIISAFELGTADLLTLRSEIRLLTMLRRRPHNIIKEHEDSLKTK